MAEDKMAKLLEYLSKRFGITVTFAHYLPSRRSGNCVFCYHLAHGMFSAPGHGHHFCSDLAACEVREKERRVKEADQARSWLEQIKIP